MTAAGKKKGTDRGPGTFECYLTYACNQRCAFCFTPGNLRRHGSIPFKELSRAIRAMRRRGHAELALLGGEPTVHPDVERIVALGRACGYRRIITFSNGLRFADRDFTARMKAAGLSSSCVSVHGHTAALHDATTGVPGSFLRAVSGIRNLLSAGIRPVLIIVVQKRNCRHLRKCAEFYWKLGVRHFMVFFLKMQGRVLEDTARAGDFIVDAREAARGVRSMFGFFRDKAAMPPALEHFPPCSLPGYESRMTDFSPGRAQAAGRACVHPGEKAGSLEGRPNKGFVYLPSCADCVYRNGCCGIDPNYLAFFGPAGLAPVRKIPAPFYSRWPVRARGAAKKCFYDALAG